MLINSLFGSIVLSEKTEFRGALNFNHPLKAKLRQTFLKFFRKTFQYCSCPLAFCIVPVLFISTTLNQHLLGVLLPNYKQLCDAVAMADVFLPYECCSLELAAGRMLVTDGGAS
jgi:hypothetical protein